MPAPGHGSANHSLLGPFVQRVRDPSNRPWRKPPPDHQGRLPHLIGNPNVSLEVLLVEAEDCAAPTAAAVGGGAASAWSTPGCWRCASGDASTPRPTSLACCRCPPGAPDTLEYNVGVGRDCPFEKSTIEDIIYDTITLSRIIAERKAIASEENYLWLQISVTCGKQEPSVGNSHLYSIDVSFMTIDRDVIWGLAQDYASFGLDNRESI